MIHVRLPTRQHSFLSYFTVILKPVLLENGYDFCQRLHPHLPKTDEFCASPCQMVIVQDGTILHPENIMNIENNMIIFAFSPTTMSLMPNFSFVKDNCHVQKLFQNSEIVQTIFSFSSPKDVAMLEQSCSFWGNMGHAEIDHYYKTLLKKEMYWISYDKNIVSKYFSDKYKLLYASFVKVQKENAFQYYKIQKCGIMSFYLDTREIQERYRQFTLKRDRAEYDETVKAEKVFVYEHPEILEYNTILWRLSLKVFPNYPGRLDVYLENLSDSSVTIAKDWMIWIGNNRNDKEERHYRQCDPIVFESKTPTHLEQVYFSMYDIKKYKYYRCDIGGQFVDDE